MIGGVALLPQRRAWLRRLEEQCDAAQRRAKDALKARAAQMERDKLLGGGVHTAMPGR